MLPINTILFFLLLLVSRQVQGQDIRVAVAANFAAPMKIIAKNFEDKSTHKVLLSFASSGKFYAQIHNGAPYHAFLSADQEKPLLLEQEGLAQESTRFTYAIGKLALWSPDQKLLKNEVPDFEQLRFNKMAMANPKLAPYGIAASQVLDSLGLPTTFKNNAVKGENINQAFQVVYSGNAELGFISLSQVWKNGQLLQGSAWIVPKHLHQPIRQDAILLKKSNNPAKLLLQFLQSPSAKKTMESFGYQVELQ